MRNPVAILLILTLLTSCGSAATTGAGSGSGQGPSLTPEAPAETAHAATAEPAPGGVHAGDHAAVITFRRSGGIAGTKDVMMVHSDGTVALDRDGATRTSMVEQALVATLQQTLAGAEWQALDQEYGEQFPDAFAYTIEGGGKTVRTYDGADNPEILNAVLRQLNDLFDKASG